MIVADDATGRGGVIRGSKLRVLPLTGEDKAHLRKGKEHAQQVIHSS